MLELILGGVRSGKSRLAEQYATASGLAVTVIATATAGDSAMAERIAAHQARRPPSWQVVEEPLALADALRAHADNGLCLLVDCLTLWLTNVLLTDDGKHWPAQRHALLDVLPRLPGHVIMVSNETNMGIIPMGELSRRYGDEAGALHQELACLCHRVTLTVAGLPLCLKSEDEKGAT